LKNRPTVHITNSETKSWRKLAGISKHHQAFRAFTPTSLSLSITAIVRPLFPASKPLERILQSWKRHSSAEINALVEQSGTFWQEESYDRIIRDEEHLFRCIQYIGRNPMYAGQNAKQCRLWIRPSWQELGWTFEENA
jgi:hypothetical protein